MCALHKSGLVCVELLPHHHSLHLSSRLLSSLLWWISIRVEPQIWRLWSLKLKLWTVRDLTKPFVFTGRYAFMMSGYIGSVKKMLQINMQNCLSVCTLTTKLNLLWYHTEYTMIKYFIHIVSGGGKYSDAISHCKSPALEMFLCSCEYNYIHYIIITGTYLCTVSCFF